MYPLAYHQYDLESLYSDSCLGCIKFHDSQQHVGQTETPISSVASQFFGI